MVKLHVVLSHPGSLSATLTHNKNPAALLDTVIDSKNESISEFNNSARHQTKWQKSDLSDTAREESCTDQHLLACEALNQL